MATPFEPLHGDEANAFAREHLVQTGIDYARWEVAFVDADGDRYVMDYLHPELQGGGTPRLRKVEGAR